MNNKERLFNNGYEDVVIFESPSYEGALVGISHDGRAVYDYNRMIESLVNDGMEYEDAIDFIEYNTIRALPYMTGAPVVMSPV